MTQPACGSGHKRSSNPHGSGLVHSVEGGVPNLTGWDESGYAGTDVAPSGRPATSDPRTALVVLFTLERVERGGWRRRSVTRVAEEVASFKKDSCSEKCGGFIVASRRCLLAQEATDVHNIMRGNSTAQPMKKKDVDI